MMKLVASARPMLISVPHTAFQDHSFEDARPRESIEFRTFTYFL